MEFREVVRRRRAVRRFEEGGVDREVLEGIARLAQRNGWTAIVVVSSPFHLTRAKRLFRRCFSGRLYFVGAPTAWWELPQEWASETVKLLVQLTVERGC